MNEIVPYEIGNLPVAWMSFILNESDSVELQDCINPDYLPTYLSWLSGHTIAIRCSYLNVCEFHSKM